jgi:DNA-binding NtrC family response regulator
MGVPMALVLIVEDEEQVRVLAESILQEHKHETLSAGTIEQALAIIEGDPKPEVLFTDIGLHGDIQAGLKLAEEAVKRLPGLRVVYTTGQGITDGMKAMFVDGFGFISKPYTADQLITSIHNIFGSAQAN